MELILRVRKSLGLFYMKNSAEMGEVTALLKVRVRNGMRLAVRDLRSSDPYVILKLGHQVIYTA